MSKKKILAIVPCWILLLLCQPLPIQAQNAETTKVTLEFKNERLPDIFKRLEKKTGCVVLFTYNDVRDYRATGSVKNKTVKEAMQLIIGDKPLSATYNGKYVNVKQKTAQPSGKTRKISGYVKDESGEALMGATIRVIGSNLIAIADKDGKFELEDISNQDQLQVSYLGMKTVTIPARNGIITLSQDNSIDEVIVTGYGSYKRGEYVGAVSQVKADDINIVSEATIDQMLQGVIPGMSVVNTTGKVGGNPKVRIRGTSTLLGNQEPLWVVDDVIQTNPNPIPNDASPLSSDMDQMMETAGNAISWLNPADIETITVLKDASATAIYGSQASNGVIVITTKKGPNGDCPWQAAA